MEYEHYETDISQKKEEGEAIMNVSLIELIALTLTIHLVDTLAFSVRLNSVKSKQFALSISLFNVFVLISRTANMFQGPLIGALIGSSIAIGVDPLLTSLAKYTTNIYGTWLSGNVVVTTDGTNYFVNTDKKVQGVQGSAQDGLQTTAGIGVFIKSIDLDKEIVVIENTSGQDVNLTGWKLFSVEGSQSFDFPAGFVIKAGQSITVASYTSTGTLKWSNGYIWNNNGDQGILYDSSGNEVSRK